MKTEEKLTLHFVPHTHWDREWYQTFQEFRYRLVKLMDRLIPILEARKEYSNFVLDGQTIVLDDYLELRPEMQERLLCLIPTGRLHVGPFYVLPDEFIVSGEALIRNLLVGIRYAQQFGRVMKVGYLPDTFGHIAQLPQILQGFGIDNFIFTRGQGDEADELGSEFYWDAPDGSSVLAVNQLGGYCNGGGLGIPPQYWSEDWQYPIDPELIRSRIRKILALHRRRSASQNILVNNGCDHLMPQPDLPKIIRFLHQEFPELHFKITNFAEYLLAVKSEKLPLQHYSGELRGGRDHHILSGVLSARIYLKQANARLQTLLEKYAEPLTAINWLLYHDQNLITYVHHAWRLLLQNQPHDSICGCSIDAVHREMMNRFGISTQIIEQVILDCLAHLQKWVENPANNRPPLSLLVWNPHAWSITAPVKQMIRLPQGIDPKKMQLTDDSGRVIPYNILFVRSATKDAPDQLPAFSFAAAEAELATLCQLRPELFSNVWKSDQACWLGIQFLAADLPPLGYRLYKLQENTEPIRITDAAAVHVQIQPKKYQMENDWLAVQVNPNGSIDLTDKSTGKCYHQLNILEDQEDVGDEYDFSPAAEPNRLTTTMLTTQRTWLKRSQLQASIQARFNWQLPIGVQRSRQRRKQTSRNCQVEIIYTLKANSPLVEIEVRFNNQVRDHRVRALFATDMVSDIVYVDDNFHVFKRPVFRTLHPKWTQQPQGTQPQQRFVAVSDKQQTFVLYNQGLPEYEVLTQQDRVLLALTLFRGVEWLSRADLLTRRGDAGPSIFTPDAQCIGQLSFHYAVGSLKGIFQAGVINRMAALFQAPPLVQVLTGELQEPGLYAGMVEILSPELSVSALKKTETRDSIILRIYNLTGEHHQGRIYFPTPLKEIWEVRLNESRINPLLWQPGNELVIDFRPYQIRSLELVPETKTKSGRHLTS